MLVRSRRVFSVGDVVDFRDKCSRWVIGEVVQVSSSQIKLRFQESYNPDEWVNKSSQRIARFGEHTSRKLDSPSTPSGGWFGGYYV